jgi:hypothetical protein
MQSDDFKFIPLSECKSALGDDHMTDAEFGLVLIQEGPRCAALDAELALLLKFGEA